MERDLPLSSGRRTETAVCHCGGLISRWTPPGGGTPMAWLHDDVAQADHAAEPVGSAA